MIFLGFSIIFSIFASSSYLQWECAQEIKKISEYHRNMSIPAIYLLEKINLGFQSIHLASIQTVESDPVIDHEAEHHSIQDGKKIFQDSIEKYDSLTFSQNSRGEFFAPKMMQMEMNNYVLKYIEIINENDLVLEQYDNKEISSSDAVVLLANIESEFHNIMDKNTQMEVQGMEKVQNEIIVIEKRMEIIFLISSIVGIISVITIIILATKFITKPISKLIGITNTIAKGEFINIDSKSRNSDVNDLLISLNEMSKDLKKYKSTIIMQEKLSSIGELASRLAHDIRNPLTIIKVTLDLIKTKNKNLTPEEVEKFERVDNAMYRITHQIDNVLDFIKGKPLKFEKYSIKDIIDSVIVDLPKSDKISIEIVSEESEIECDFEAMKVILINLIINAIQAIKGEGKIKISSKIRGDKVVIEIEDSGPGIPEEILEKIFEPLYTTKEEGTGLGLVSCKSLVEQHHGKISVKSNPTRFIIELPKNL